MALRRAQPPAEAPWRPSLNPQLCLEGPCAKPKPACEQSQLRGLREVTPPAVPQAATLGWLPAGPGPPCRFLRLSHPSPQLPGCPAALLPAPAQLTAPSPAPGSRVLPALHTHPSLCLSLFTTTLPRGHLRIACRLHCPRGSLTPFLD